MIAVIMAGGAGTRFWPRSREAEPKQFLPLVGEKSLLADTVERIAPLVPPERVLIVTGNEFVDRVRREMPGIPASNVLGEPLGRNTAPCVALAAARASRKWGGDEVMAVLPADHHIGDRDRFLSVLSAGEEFCRREKALLTIGVEPTGPETGYGYLEIGEALGRAGEREAFRVARFVEKPNRAKAEEYLGAGRFLWNSGMFLWRVDVIIDALKEHMPGASKAFPLFREAAEEDLYAVLEWEYPRLPSISIDYAVMEKASNVAVIPADFPWSDVGSWNALGGLLRRDDAGNETVGEHLGIDTRRCVIVSGDRLVATIGVEDLIVVETDDAILVCPRDRAQEVRSVVERLRESGREDLL